MEYKKTAFHCEAGVATITMDCPENLNAIDVDMAKELLERLYQCDRSSEVKVVVLKGGVRAFSAGGDIRYLYDNIQRGVVESSELVVLVGKLALAMKQLNKLVICAVSGSAAGAGANLALSGDFVVCSENARFIQAFVGIALVPDTGGPYLLSRSIGAQRALEMCITGRPVPAEEALRLGLVHEICPREELEERTMALARKLAAGPLFADTNLQKQVYGAAFHDYDRYLHQVEETTMNSCADTHDYREGVRAFVEKRSPQFNGT